MRRDALRSESICFYMPVCYGGGSEQRRRCGCLLIPTGYCCIVLLCSYCYILLHMLLPCCYAGPKLLGPTVGIQEVTVRYSLSYAIPPISAHSHSLPPLPHSSSSSPSLRSFSPLSYPVSPPSSPLRVRSSRLCPPRLCAWHDGLGLGLGVGDLGLIWEVRG
jgi:hypothetical protein